MATNPLDKVYLTEAQLQTLASGGSITSGSDIYTADENTLYLTDDNGGGLAVLTGSTNPTTSTVGELGQIYIDTTHNTIWQCVKVDNSTYYWTNIGGGGVTNSTSFMAGGALSSTGIAIGQTARASGNYRSVAIGENATSGTSSVALGCNSNAGGTGTASIGDSARINNVGVVKACQILEGTNSTSYSLQFYTDNIYKADTHTATFKNIQQGVTNTTGAGGNPVYGIMSGSSAPTTSTAGSVGQFYLDTTDSKLYQCRAIDTSITPNTYTWTEIGGGVSTTYETYTISSWTALSSSSPYTYQATVTATATIGNDTLVELINDQAVLFATYGFAIGSISGQNVTIYSIGEPSSSVTLKIGYGG